jgi:hypothetical protein
MYHISDQQIDYILNDISARGVEMESLQQHLLDHICCIIENNLEENGDFESFYQKTVETFYKDQLWEIEEETLQLLTFKNYYTMKKVMIVSGTFSAAAMIFGILFKFLHWPGASALIVLGIGVSSLIFLPLLFTLKIKEQQNTKDKIGLGLITMSGILLCLSVLFKVMHWPGANILGVTFIIVLGLLFLPFNFYSGIRNPERKTNTITMSILIIIFCGLWLTLIRTPQASKILKIDDTYTILRQEQILINEINYLKSLKKDSLINTDKLGNEILHACNALKSFIIKHETGFESIPNDFENKEVFIESHDMVNLLNSTPDVNELLSKISSLVEQYNNNLSNNSLNSLPVSITFIEYYKTHSFRSMNTINLLKQINNLQMFVLQNQELL